MDTSSNINNILNKSFSLPNITDHEVDNYTLIRTSYTQEIFHGKQFKRMIKYLSCEEISREYVPGTMRNKVEVVIDKSCIEIPSRASIPEVSSNNIEKSLKIEPKRIRNIENPLPENPVKNKHINENSYYRYLNIL
ncbi:hypothetical protein HHI36_019960 [Cryptolaemus montrouzieri]|uniref:Uncharacterized protein n=1 Tax=Cryptolaemus montrouzieri TaxID=559131 RepID=A0ABD2N916_9CUCU